MQSDEVSDVHAAFVTTHGTTFVTDLSQTATYVNDSPILETELHHGDRVRLGPYEFEFDAPSQVPRAGQPGLIAGRLDGPRPEQSRPIDCCVFTIGRRTDADLRLTDASISYLHAIIVSQSGGHAILDLGSRTGTLVNGKRIGLHTLKDGERIQIGPETLQYSLPDQAPAPVTEPAAQPEVAQPATQPEVTQSPVISAAPAAATAPTDATPLEQEEWPRLAPVVGHRRRRGVVQEQITGAPEPAAQHPDLAPTNGEPPEPTPVQPQQHRRGPVLGLLLTSLLLLAGASAGIWHFLKPGFSVQSAMSFQLVPPTDAESAAAQRMQEVLLADAATREAAIAQLPDDVKPGFLAGSGDFAERAVIQWQRLPAAPEQARLILSVRGKDDSDALRVGALMKALFDASRNFEPSELERLQSELAAVDDETAQREMNYLQQRLKELAEEVRVLELTSADPDAIAALQKAVSDARNRHQRAVEERIRTEVKHGRARAAAADADLGSEPASTQPATKVTVSPLPRSGTFEEKRAREALEAAENKLREVLASEQQLAERRTRLQSMEQRMAALKKSRASGTDTQPASRLSRTTALPPERTVVVPDPDKRGWWIAAASVATAALFAVTVAFTRSPEGTGHDE